MSALIPVGQVLPSLNVLPAVPVSAFQGMPGAIFGQSRTESFADLISGGFQDVNAKLLHADDMVKAFALDDSIPVHQVTFAIEQARLSFELMMQVRNRLVEGYQQLMTMQL